MKLRKYVLFLTVAALTSCESKKYANNTTESSSSPTETTDSLGVASSSGADESDAAGGPAMDSTMASASPPASASPAPPLPAPPPPLNQTYTNRLKLEHLKNKVIDANLTKAQAKETKEQLQDLRFNSNKIVKVFFATDRQKLENSPATDAFGKARGTLKYGVCLVNIPPKHSIGVLESPSLLKLEFHNDPNKHLFVTQTSIINASNFFNQVKQGVKATRRESAFIFVHGYNVSFDEAARRTAQIACDINFDGVPLFFSWPSQATLEGYLADENNIDWAQQHLESFLKDFMEKSDAKNVYCIAHSMGNRGLTRALTSLLQKNPAFAPRIKELILAAPDIDQEIFVRDIAPMITTKMPPITMYVSSKDKAIMASKLIHKERRAGEGGSDILVTNGVETIDASAIDMSFLGHGYLAEERPVIEDLSWLVMHDERAAKRPMLLSVGGKYWTFKP